MIRLLSLQKFTFQYILIGQSTACRSFIGWINKNIYVENQNRPYKIECFWVPASFEMRVILLLALIGFINAFSNWSNALKLLMKNSLQDNRSIATLKKYFGSQGEMELLIKTSLIDRKTAKKIVENFNRKSMTKASNRLNRFLKFHNDH